MNVMNVATIEKILFLLNNHKGKTLSVLGILTVLRFIKSSGQGKKILDLISQKLEKKLKAQLKEKEKYRKLTTNFEELYLHFLSLNKGIKRNLKRDISAIFDIESLRESARAQNLSEQERSLLLDQLKTQVFFHAIFSIIYISISKVILFIRECILNKHEILLEGEPERNLLVLESFFSDFSEFIIRNSGKFLYTYLTQRLQPLLVKLELKQKYTEADLLDIFERISNIITEVHEDNQTPGAGPGEDTPYGTNLSFDEAIGNDTTFIDVNGICGLLREENEQDKGLVSAGVSKNPEKGDLKFPQFQIRVLKAFSKTTEGQRITENIDYFIRYFYTGGARDPNTHNGLCGIAEVVEEEEDKEDSFCGRKMSKGVKKNGVLVIDLEEEETKASHEMNEEIEGEENKERILKVMKVASDEFLDLIECGNFNLYGLYAINYEMKKLMNRISMYFRRKGGDGVTLLSFLPALHKIINEEVIDEDAEQTNEAFYNSQIKLALGAMGNKEMSAEDLLVNCKVMEEFEMKRHVDNGFKEFGKRIFMDKEYNKAQEMSRKNGGKFFHKLKK